MATAACAPADRQSVDEQAAAAEMAGIDRDVRPDATISTEIQSRYYSDDSLRGRRIDVRVNDLLVALDGTVSDDAARQRAVTLAKDVAGVREVDNRLELAPAGALGDEGRTARGEDAVRDADGPSVPGATDVNAGWITTKAQAAYFVDRDIKARNIDVTTTDTGIVMLEGHVETEQASMRAADIASGIDGVRHVDNQLRVVPEGATDSGVTAARRDDDAAGDGWVTMKIQSKYFLEDDVKGRDIDVTARDGIVTLTGAVASDTARRTAEAIARDTDGVARVVNRLRVAPAEAGADDDGDTDTQG